MYDGGKSRQLSSLLTSEEYMLKRLFNILSEKISFGFAVSLFSTTGSWIAAFYGFYLFYAISPVTVDRDFYFYVTVLFIGTTLAILTHLFHYGMFHRIGLSGLTGSVRIINAYFTADRVFYESDEISDDTFFRLHAALIELPRNNLVSATIYTIMVIVQLSAGVLLTGRGTEVLPPIAFGGLFSSIIIGYFTYNITEYLIGPYKERLENILYQKSRNLNTRYYLSYRNKSYLILLLILLSMIILTVLIRYSHRPISQITIFITLSIIAIGFLVYLSINTVTISLSQIIRATKNLAAGGKGLYFPYFSDRELVTFSEHYNKAAIEINEIREDLERKVRERTEELKNAYDRLNEAYSQTQADLLLAKKIQKRILPEKFQKLSGISCVIHYFPVNEVGGDIYDIVELYPGYIRFFLADAAGHGIQAALVTMIIKSEYEKVKFFDDTAMMLESLNNSFIDLYESLNVFFSCIIVDIDINSRHIVYSSAGHPDQILIRKNGIEMISHTGKLVGILKNTRYTTTSIPAGSGEKIMLFTDGLFEAFNDDDEEFGEERLRKIIRSEINNSTTDLFDSILANLAQHVGKVNKVSVYDDITLIGIDIE